MDTEKMDQYMLDKKFPLECEKLPWEYLDEDEKQLAEKCMNHEELTGDELKELKLLLNTYRPFFKKYDVKTAEKNIEKTSKVVRTQSELLELLHDPNRYRIDMNIFIMGEPVLAQMRIKPFTDKQYLEGVASQMGLFRDLSVDDKKLINKAQSNATMSPEEEKMYNSIMDKINEKLNNEKDLVVMMNNFLADRISFVDDNELQFEDKLSFWKEVEMDSRIALFNEVRSRLGLNETFEEELFPPVR